MTSYLPNFRKTPNKDITTNNISSKSPINENNKPLSLKTDFDLVEDKGINSYKLDKDTQTFFKNPEQIVCNVLRARFIEVQPNYHWLSLIFVGGILFRAGSLVTEHIVKYIQ